jgi:hypothetical protein
MSIECGREARQITEFLGLTCDGANPVVTFRNPLELANWTLPVLELLIVAGAVYAFVHAWRRWRRDGDPVNIALWFASLVYLAVVEPPLYFPEWFDLQKYVGFIFAHNAFTVQFMFDRLPLYIVAFYTVSSQLIYEVVRVLGIFARRGAFVGAVAAAFVSQVFYEIFDQLGPQLKWWAWNPGNTVNQPMLASVPMNSMWVFASVSFGALVWLVVTLVGERPGRSALSGGQVAWRTVAAGVLTPVLMVVLAAPTRVGVEAGGDHALQRTLVIVLLAALWVVGIALVVDAHVAGRAAAGVAPGGRVAAGAAPGGRVAAAGGVSRPPVPSPGFARIYPAIYLLVLAGLWVSALPEYVAAQNGMTAAGTPIGCGPYVIACLVAAAGIVVATARATSLRSVGESGPPLSAGD